MSIFAANTDGLHNEKLRAALRLMAEAAGDFRHRTQANLPPGQIRCETDSRMQEGLSDRIEVSATIVDGIARLAHGDTGNVDNLRTLLERVEESSIDISASGNGGPAKR